MQMQVLVEEARPQFFTGWAHMVQQVQQTTNNTQLAALPVVVLLDLNRATFKVSGMHYRLQRT